MVLNSISSKAYKFIYIYFILLFAVTIYIFISKENFKSNFEEEVINDFKQKYLIYKKIYKTSSLKSFLIENENFIDNTDMVEELSKSTPFIMKKEDKELNKYSITFSFTPKSKNYTKTIEDNINKLEEKEYFIEFQQDSLILFAKVYDDGYIFITKKIPENEYLNSLIDQFFIELFLFALVNILVLIYFISIIKNTKKVASRMISEFEQLKDDTQKMAFEDTLTKAATRLKFDQTLKDLVQVASRFEQNIFSVIMFDIDNFKKLNDTHGHDFGDFVLKSVSNTVKNNIRGSDTFARWGGEEFVVLSPMTDLQQAKVIAEKLREEIASMKFPQSVNVTCSFGVVVYENSENGEQTMKRVDKLLYKAKQTGKNKVEAK